MNALAPMQPASKTDKRVFLLSFVILSYAYNIILVEPSSSRGYAGVGLLLHL
jgi:hypothetical protein